MFGGGFPGPMFGAGFEGHYRVHSIAFMENKSHLENGDKILLPPSALDRLAAARIDYPMLFEIHSPNSGRTSHCGVMEFVADEGQVYLPNWMMENLALSENDIVRLRNCSLPKATYVKLQPETKDFLDITNPKAVLERNLRNYSCLTVGDKITINYNNKKYYIGIVEGKPRKAVTIIETDCEVDFAPPLDYVEPEPQPRKVSDPKDVPMGFGKPPPRPRANSSGEETAAAGEKGGETPPAEPSFAAFTGSGRRIDGKGSSPAKAMGSAQRKGSGGASSSGAGSSSSRSTTSAAAPSDSGRGKMAFGPPSSSSGEDGSAKAKAEEGSGNDDKFKAFSGKSYRLS